MTTARRPGTIPPKAKQVMLLTAACVTVLANTVLFISANSHRWGYHTSPTSADGPRLARLNADDATGRVPVQPRARTISLVLNPPSDAAETPAVGPRDDADRWAPASAWRRERLRPE